MCAAKCCENQSASKDAVQQCMNQCFAPLHQVQEYMTKELQNFQVYFKLLVNIKVLVML